MIASEARSEIPATQRLYIGWSKTTTRHGHPPVEPTDAFKRRHDPDRVGRHSPPSEQQDWLHPITLLVAAPRLIERAGTLRDSLSSHHTNRMLALSSAHAKGYLLRTRTPGLPRTPLRSPKCFDWTLLPGDSSNDVITHDQQSQRALSDTGETFIKLYNFFDTTSPYI